MKGVVRGLAGAALVIAGVDAQIIVDANGGPGASFTTIAAAVATVPSGSVLVVRQGFYGGFTIDNKAIVVLADPGVFVDGFVTFVRVRNLASDQGVVLHGLQIRASLAAARFELQDCWGPVLLQRCSSTGLTGGAVVAANCGDVQLVDCTLAGVLQAPLVLGASVATLARTTLTGTAATTSLASLTVSRVHITDCTLAGNAGTSASVPLVQIDATSSVRLDGSTSLTALASGQPTWGIGPSGTVRRDPAVTIVATTPMAAGVTAVVVPLPSVAVSVPAFGASGTATLRVPPGGIGGLFAGLPSTPFVVPLFQDPIAVDLATLVPLGAGSGTVVVGFVVPATGILLGERLCWQGWSHDPLGGFQASNALVAAPR